MILDISQDNKYTETEKKVIDYLMNHLDLLEELCVIWQNLSSVHYC